LHGAQDAVRGGRVVTQGEPDDSHPSGSVGRYVRDRWDADVADRRSRRRPPSAIAPPGPSSPAGVPGPRSAPVEELRPTSTPPWGFTGSDDDPARTGYPRQQELPEAHAARPYVAAPVLPNPPTPDAVRDGSAPPPAVDPLAPGGPVTPPRGARWVDPGAVAAQEAQRQRSGVVAGVGVGGPPADLSSARLLRPAKRPPQSGWRRLVYVLSGRLINPGESPADIHRRELVTRVNAPLLGCHKIALLSLKGGVGKTTMTATLGATFASLRGDRVVAVDANPDRGTLSQKIPLETSATVRHLLRDAQRVRRYTDVRAYTSQGASRLEVLASEQDPAVSEAFSEDDYRRTVTLLEHFYNMVLTDCGTGLMHSAMYGVLGVADQIVVVSSGSIDGARSASATMDWLDAHGHGDLVSGAVAVINCVSRSAGGVDLDRVAAHFAGRCRAVVRIPFDAHLQEGAEVDLDRLEPRTRLALLELAAEVADAFPA
jgi:MinD-like ATPase involved in chromosome partitioning or flagellar assembly